jgi:hypothetical protein
MGRRPKESLVPALVVYFVTAKAASGTTLLAQLCLLLYWQSSSTAGDGEAEAGCENEAAGKAEADNADWIDDSD